MPMPRCPSNFSMLPPYVISGRPLGRFARGTYAAPTRRHLTRQPLEWHPRHVTEPACLPTCNVDLDTLETHALPELLRGDVVIPGVLTRDAAHRAQALRMEAPQLSPESLCQAPALTAEQADGKHMCGPNPKKQKGQSSS